MFTEIRMGFNKIIKKQCRPFVNFLKKIRDGFNKNMGHITRMNMVINIFLKQKSTKNSVELLVDEREVLVNDIALKLGLRRVGWIFTDLVAKDLSSGTVKHFRGNIVSIRCINHCLDGY